MQLYDSVGMSRKRIVSFAFRGIVPLILWIGICNAKGSPGCFPSSCGNIRNITYPFRLEGGPNCQGSRLNLSCQENRTVLSLNSKRYYVEFIDYDNFTLRVVDPGVEKNNCSSFPIYSISDDEMVYHYPYLVRKNIPLLFISCPTAVNSSKYIDASSCGKNRSSSSISFPYSLQAHTYVVFGDKMKILDLNNICSVDLVTWISDKAPPVNMSFSSIHDGMAYGFDLYWVLPRYSSSPRLSRITWYALYVATLVAIFLGGRCFCGTLCLFALLGYKWRRRHSSVYETIEDFLQGDNNLSPIRYTYGEIRKMTSGFKEKLGEGGFGTVYKGKLRSGITVAVKMIMEKSNTSGQEFISEVSTIGRIHHVNVVRLVGYCAQGSKRALVYEFMPNGSLEKYIFPDQGEETGTTPIMCCERMFEISLAVARAIDYLHRGCDMQILHFDIKPHNILLDENFTPKISDFGLAKLYSAEDLTVTLTAARGTMGYMAPELFYRNIGGVSYKADVYSFGMLLLEMAGRRKNLNPIVEQLSQIYFPFWVYDQMNQGNNIDQLGETNGCDKVMIKKMIIVAFWCIQMKPDDRPCMSKVVEMLEGDFEILSMPPKPFFSPQETTSG